jgi:hypothetical protein
MRTPTAARGGPLLLVPLLVVVVSTVVATATIPVLFWSYYHGMRYAWNVGAR